MTTFLVYGGAVVLVALISVGAWLADRRDPHRGESTWQRIHRMSEENLTPEKLDAGYQRKKAKLDRKRARRLAKEQGRSVE